MSMVLLLCALDWKKVKEWWYVRVSCQQESFSISIYQHSTFADDLKFIFLNRISVLQAISVYFYLPHFLICFIYLFDDSCRTYFFRFFFTYDHFSYQLLEIWVPVKSCSQGIWFLMFVIYYDILLKSVNNYDNFPYYDN